MRKIIIISVICVFLLAPVLAKITSIYIQNSSEPQTSSQLLTKDEATTAIKNKNSSLPTSQKFSSNFSVVSIKRTTKWWYIVTIKLNNINQPLLISKFNDNTVRVVTLPGESLPYYNMSGGLGVPYETIDELNKYNAGD